jgi:dolichyl-phosphate-mannose--protein O-mannosyl transferase
MFKNKLWILLVAFVIVVIVRNTDILSDRNERIFDFSVGTFFALAFIPVLIYFFNQQQNLFIKNVKSITKSVFGAKKIK